MTKDAIFEIYSMTKPLVSVAAMMLVEEGRLQLTDPVAKFLPEFANLQVSVPELDPVSGKLTYSRRVARSGNTVQDLLRHPPGSLSRVHIPRSGQGSLTSRRASLSRAMELTDVRDLTPEDEIGRLAKAPLAQLAQNLGVRPK